MSPVSLSAPPRAEGAATHDPRAAARAYLVHAAVLAGLGVAAALLPARVRVGTWAPLHLAFTGAATLGVTGATTFFLATLRGAPVPPPAMRTAHIVWHEAALVALIGGRAAGLAWLIPVGGGMFVASVAWVASVVAWQALRSTRRRWPGQPAAYLTALGLLASGAVYGTLLASTTPPAGGYITHVSLNLFGFLGVVALGSLPRFYPMVVRVRMRHTPFSNVPWLLVAAGAATMATGHPVGLLLGAAGAMGAAAMAAEERWRSHVPLDPDGVHILLALCWYSYGWIAAAAFGGPQALARVVHPLVAGFVVQIFMGAVSYLAPALAGGASTARRRARATIGRMWVLRAALLNAGAALLATGRLSAGWAVVGVAAAWFFGSVIRAASAD